MLAKIYSNFCSIRTHRDAAGMQCKNVPDQPILEFLLSLGGRWANWYEPEYENSVRRAMPERTPPKLALAKMRRLMRRGLVQGCGCGCRGDFVLTAAGRELVSHIGPDSVRLQ